MLGHAFALTGHAPPEILANGVHSIGVKIFFAISGFLVARSWKADPSLPRFLARRTLRLMPGLVLLCLLTVLLLGPLATTLPSGDYFADPATANYFWNLALYPIYRLPGVFAGNTVSSAVNGSLWTLPVEAAMYVAMAMLALVLGRACKLAAPAAAVLLLAASLYFVRTAPIDPPVVVWGTALLPVLDVAFYFGAGAAIAVQRLERFANVPASACAFVAAALLVHHPIWGEVALAVLLPWLTISVGLLSIRALAPLDGRDYSYGLYLYAFPVQQAAVQLAGTSGPLTNMLTALPAALVLAALSWELVERRALARKPPRPETDR